MKKAILYLFIGLSLEVWLVEMFTGWFDHASFTNSSLVPGD